MEDRVGNTILVNTRSQARSEGVAIIGGASAAAIKADDKNAVFTSILMFFPMTASSPGLTG